jgi:DNA repair exonuclease SbcCD ATPase subunit
MDLEQLNKKIEWLDEERRKDKTTIAMLSERISVLEGNNSGTLQELKSIQSETSRLNAMVGKIDQIQDNVAQLKVDLSKNIELIDKARKDQLKESDKVRKSEIDSVNKSILELRKPIDTITEIKRTLQVRQEEEFRLNRLIGEADKKISEFSRSDEEYKRSIRLVEEGRRQDSKRLTDLLGEVTAIRKRLDEQRGKVDLTTDSTRKLELRVGELINAESERRQSVSSFIEKQTVQQMDRDRLWKEWQDRFATFDKQTSIIEAQLQNLDAMQRSVKRSQDALDEITQKFDRRINEITEVARINEERFRQDWTAFKNDDQKRWANNSLNQEEQYRDLTRQLEKFQEKLINLDDLTQELNDLVIQGNEETQKRIQSLISLAHSWAEDFSRITKTGG